MESNFGKQVKVTVFGESHGECIGGCVENLPAGIPLDMDALMAFMRRRQGGGGLTTPRKEADLPIFTSGVTDGKTDGGKLCFTIENASKRSGDYSLFREIPRPSHADYTALLRFGEGCDIRGGGHFSGRLTAPLCVAGYFALSALASRGITVGAHLYSVGEASDTPYDPVTVCTEDFVNLEDFPARDKKAAEAMKAEVLAAAREGDSVGGVIECAALGLPAGLGDPLYDGIENRLSAALFGLGGVRGVEFGTGFAAAKMRGYAHNDAFIKKNGRVETETNHHGGVLGGITSGMPLLFRAAFKPTASISLPQRTLSLKTGEQTELAVTGRHDPCIAVRAVPCVEALTALVLLDFLTEREKPTTLAEARAEIDRINREILSLFKERLAAAAVIAEHKKKIGAPILDERREEEILAEMTALAGEEYAPYARELFRTLMAGSRSYQAKLLKKDETL